MGRLTEDMTRLRGEIGSLHEAREARLADLARGTAEMRSGFRSALSHMARNAKVCRAEFVSGLKHMARNAKVCRVEFMSGVKHSVDTLKRNVGNLRHEFAADLMGARQAWCGAGAPAREGNGSSRSGKTKKNKTH